MNAVCTERFQAEVLPVARQNLRQTLLAYMNDAVPTAAFTKSLAGFEQSPDRSVREIASDLIDCYDFDGEAATTTEFHADRSLWNRLQRILLFLDTGERIPAMPSKWQWGFSQLFALLALAAFASLLCMGRIAMAYGIAALSVTLLGIPRLKSNAAAARKEREKGRPLDDPELVWPFADLAAIRRSLRKRSSFKKEPCPQRFHLQEHTTGMSGIELLIGLLGGVILFPMLLVFLSLPRRREISSAKG